MHPAFSVIFLTTLIGVGQGLFLALFTGQLYSVVNVLPVQDSHSFYGYGSLLARVFLGVRRRCGARRGCRARSSCCRRSWD
jgi:hypothetical protein